MAPMTGILLTDFYLIKKKKYNVLALYDPKGIYHYWVSTGHIPFARKCPNAAYSMA